MEYDRRIHQRRSIRLQQYDYSCAGIYFVTVCVQDRRQLLGRIENGIIELTGVGQMVHDALINMPSVYADVTLDSFIVMPNHVHALIALVNRTPGFGVILESHSQCNGRDKEDKQVSLADVIRRLKSYTANRYWKEHPQTLMKKLWQRNYYEHVVRDSVGLTRIRNYIAGNVAEWHLDRENEDRNDTNPFYEWLESYCKCQVDKDGAPHRQQ